MPSAISESDLLLIAQQPQIDDRIGLARCDLGEFTRLFWSILEPASPYIPGWHLDAVNDHLEAVARGEIRNLLINIPPRHCKSLAVSVFFPVWMWLSKPATRFLYSSYALSLSIRDSRKCRSLIEHPRFQGAFGDCFGLIDDNGVTSEAGWPDRFELVGDQNTKGRFENNRTGYRISTSVGGAATGEGGDIVVADDPHSVQEKESDVVRESTLIWWDETMSTRLNDPKTGRKVIVMQRIHEKDLSGHVLQQGGYEHLCLPAEYVPSRKCVTSRWQDPRTTEGELLWPERVGPTEIANLKRAMGPSGYSGQFQQSPNPAGGLRFKSQYFRYFKHCGDLYQLFGGGMLKAVPKHGCWRFAVIDPAGVEKQQNNKPCYTVLQVWEVTPDSDMLLLDQKREMMQTPEVAKMAIDTCRLYAVSFLGVEKNGLGLGVMQTIMLSGVAVLPIEARGTKEARSETAEIRIAAGKVFFPHGAPFLFDLTTELEQFPNGEYADQVDTLSHAAAIVQERHGPPKTEEDREWEIQRDREMSEMLPAGRYANQF